MNNEKFDDWFDEAFDQAFERAATAPSPVSIDSKRASWQEVKQQLAVTNKRKQHKRRFQFAAVIAASIALGAIVFSPPVVTQAISPIYQQIKEWGDGFVTIVTGKVRPTPETIPKTSPPPDMLDGPEELGNLGERLLWSSNSKDFNFTLEEVKSRITFPFTEFGYIPEGYHFSEVMVAPKNDTAPIYNMTIQYISESDKILNLIYFDLDIGEVAVSILSTPKTEKLHLKSGIEAIYTQGPSSADSIQFTYNNVLIQILGELSKEELLKIANSLP